MTLAAIPRWQWTSGGLLAALAAIFLVGFTPQGQAAAQQFLSQFRSQRFTVVTVDPRASGTSPFQALERLGTVSGAGAMNRAPVAVASVDEASRQVGFAVKQPGAATLPAGMAATPRVRVAPGGDVRFTFDRERASALAAAQGQPSLTLPEGFHGASLVVSVPTVALLEYGEPGAGAGTGRSAAGSLLVAQARELAVRVESAPGGPPVTLEQMRDLLLSLPGLPPDTVRQLRAIPDWRTTLPIPLPADQVSWQQTTIAGGPGLILAESSGSASAAIWQRDGIVYGVAGTLRTDEVRRVADSLR